MIEGDEGVGTVHLICRRRPRQKLLATSFIHCATLQAIFKVPLNHVIDLFRYSQSRTTRPVLVHNTSCSNASDWLSPKKIAESLT